MHLTDEYISPFIRTQFPAIYQEEGELFIQFVKAYFEYLEQDGKAIHETRNLFAKRDIDNTVDEYVKYFKSKFLNGIQFSAVSDQRFLVKHAFDLYKAKGSRRSYELLFQLIYGEDIEVDFPSESILKPSDGDFFEPIYLEIENNARAATFISKEITGSTSGAKAFVESIARKVVDGKQINQLFLSNVRGNFQTGELVTDDGSLLNAPIIIGSLTTVTVTDGGQDNEVGDVFDIIGARGKQGKARVTAITDGTGRVNFQLEDGGFGFTLTNDTEVKVSTGVLNLTNISGTFEQFETITQPLNDINLIGVNGTFNVNDIVVGANSTSTAIANGYIVAGSGNSFVVSTLSGDFSSAPELQINGNASVNATIDTVTNTTITANGIGLNTQSIGIHGNTGAFYANGAYVTGSDSSATANVLSIATGANATFSVGSLENEETVSLYTDLLGANNTGGVPFLSLLLNASNSNTTGFGFPKDPSADINDVLDVALTSNTFTIGTISSIAGINPGAGYNTDPFVSIRMPEIAGFNRQDQVLTINNLSGSFAIGETLTQTLSTSSVVLDIADITGSFTDGEGIIQTSSSANGTVYASNSTNLTVIDVRGTFTNTDSISAFVSGATANVTLATANNVDTDAKGIVRSANTSEVTLKRITFATSFDTSTAIRGSTSNATANVISITSDTNSNPSGFNANVSATVRAASGIATQVQVLDSGYGYENNTAVTLTTSNNSFVITGTTGVARQGIAEGFWQNEKSFLNSSQKIHDNSFYQDYSYVIKSGLSIDKYSELLKNIFHVAGTELFGEVVREATITALQLQVKESSVTTS